MSKQYLKKIFDKEYKRAEEANKCLKKGYDEDVEKQKLYIQKAPEQIRKIEQKQKEIANFRKNLEVGQEVITAGGIYGKIKEIEDNTVVLEIASGVKIKIDRNSIFANAASNQQQAK